MDTRISIKLRKYRYNNSSYDDFIIFDKFIYSDTVLGDNIFSFKEYDRVDLLFETNNEDAVLVLESYSSDSLIEVKNGQKVVLSPGGDSDKMLVPGFYSLDLKINSIEYKGLYSVAPNSLDKESLLQIRDTLDSICKGLSSNIYYERSGMNYISGQMLSSDVLAFTYIESKRKEILNVIHSIIKNPIEDLLKVYKSKEISKNPDSKSIRYKNSKIDILNSRRPYKEKVSVISVDTPENNLVKTIIKRLYYSINQISFKLHKHMEFLRLKENDISIKLISLNDDKRKLLNLYNVKHRLYEIDRDIEIYKKEIEEYNTKIDKLNCSIRNIDYCKNSLITFQDKDWVKSLIGVKQLKPTKKFLKRPDYNFIYKMYLEVLDKSKVKEFTKTFPSKKTSLLYEIYSVIVTKDIFEELGFTWNEGWIKSVEDIFTFNGDLESGEKIILNKDNYKVEVVYDAMIKRASEVKMVKNSEIVASNSQRRKPDILICLYRDNIFVKSMIIEVKYRKGAYIYNSIGETDVIHQLKEYRNLDYYDGDMGKVSPSRPIQKVLVVYPDSKEKKIEEGIYGFSFVTLMPRKDRNPIGYEIIKREIAEFLKENL